MSWHKLAMIVLTVAGSARAAAQDAADDRFKLKLSGFANATLGVADRAAGTVDEGEIEASPQFRLGSGVTIAARAAVNISSIAIGPDDRARLSLPEISAFAIGSFGRIEIGRRAGFPQSLIGFTPSEIAFTVAEYGPESGMRLDPNGGLPSALLGAERRDTIERLAYLGYAARFYDDRSAKIIYLSPRFKSGLYGAISYTPRAEDADTFRIAGVRQTTGPRFRDIVQAALVWNQRTEAIDLSVGATLSHATTIRPPTARPTADSVTSLSGGISLTLHDSWTVGLSATWDGLSPGSVARAPYGVVASLNYVAGPWIAGGYIQHARAPISTTPDRDDAVDVAQLGISYFADHNHDLLGSGFYTDVKLFASVTHYSSRTAATMRRADTVATAGVRFAFF